MAERVYPTSRPNGTAPNTATQPNNPSFPATKSQLYGANRPTYRPQPEPPRRRRSCCCSCCLWSTLILFILIILIAIAGAVFYILYLPHRPSFTVESLKMSEFNLTSSSTLLTNFNLTLTSRNPNKKLVFLYNPISIDVFSRNVDIGSGIFPAFIHDTKNTTILRASIVGNSSELDSATVTKLQSDMKSKTGVPLNIELNTKVKIKFGGIESNKLMIRVLCDGIKSTVPTKNSSVTATTSGSNCKVDLRFKIWRWTF